MIKKLLKSVRQYKLVSILTPVFMIGEVFFELLIPMLTSMYILDYLTGLQVSGASPDMLYLLKWGVIIIGCGVLSFSFGTLSGVCAAKASAGFGGNLRHDLYYSVQNFSFGNIDKFSTASLVTRLTTDVTNVQNAYMTIIRMGVRAPMMMIVAFFMAIRALKSIGEMQLNFMLTVYGIIIPVLVAGIVIIMAIDLPFFNKLFKKYDALNESVQENVKGMRVVKAYVREDYEKKKFGKASGQIKKDFTLAERIIGLSNPLMMICMYVMQFAVYYICAKTGISATNPDPTIVGKLNMLVNYSISVLMSFTMLSMVFVMITMSIASAKRICEVLDEKSDIVSPEHAVCEVKDGSVKFENVNFKYSKNAEKFALSDINLDIKSGETVGIIGGTGSSKTSLVNLISRLYDATEGTVTVGGVNVKDYDLDTLRNKVAVVLQKNLLFSGTIAENIRWGDENATDEEVEHVCKLAQADEFIQGFPDKYQTHIEQGGSNVSGGQKQRLCIARALLKKPKIIIFDDSTSAVDTKTDALIRAALKNDIPDTTKIIIAQRIASVQDADKIVVMDNGRINGVGTHEELLKTNEIYREVYETQNRAQVSAADLSDDDASQKTSGALGDFAIEGGADR